jgi:PIN domain nuclease of toxin-antitoxin system
VILLDTCALIWIADDHPVLPAALTAVERAVSLGELYLSPVSAWEIGLLVTRGRLVLDVSAGVWVSRAFSRPGVQIAALTPEIAVRSSHLPGTLHGDPADRMLIATAMLMGLKLMTRDRRILDYASQGYVSVVPC